MHIQSMKEQTKYHRIKPIEDPDLFMVPLFNVFGANSEPVVNTGDEVKKYQLIGKSVRGFMVPTHSPVSGIVESIEEKNQLDGSVAKTIFIRNNNKNEEAPIFLKEPDTYTAAELLKVIERAGVVGMGGAKFPTAVKYDKKDKQVNTLIINGVECEPYLSSDYVLMKQCSKEILDGILFINKILDAENIIIAVESINDELKDIFEIYLNDEKYKNISVSVVPDEYPQGGELQLVKTLTGIEIPKGSIPLNYGVIVSNVGTVYSIFRTIMEGIPVTERIITVSGENVKNPGNYLVKIGTPVNHIVEACGIDIKDSIIISGGPMMSPQVRDLYMPINKGSLGIIVLPHKDIERLNCIWCGYCVDVCPMKLMPMKFDQFFRRGKYLKLNDYNIKDCIECGACEYICPSNVPLIRSIKEGKSKLLK